MKNLDLNPEINFSFDISDKESIIEDKEGISSSIENIPLVSVVVPVYNGAKYLKRCLECLIHQTLSPIEIIFVDKESTDNTLAILKEYQNYCDFLFVYSIKYSDTPAAGRNYGIKMARAEYIGFSDADDMMSYDAMEKMYEEAIEHSRDLVISQFYEVKNGINILDNVLNMPLKIGDIIKYSNISFWNKLIKKSILVENGTIDENTIFDDFSYIIPLISFIDIKKIGYVRRPLYFHIMRGDSESGNQNSEKMLHSIIACEKVVKNTSSLCLDYAIYRVAKWMLYNIEYRYKYASEFKSFFVSHKEWFILSTELSRDKPAYSKIKKIIEDNISPEIIPKRIYIHDSVVKKNEEQFEKSSCFLKDYQIVELKSDNFAISDAPDFFLKKDKNDDSLVKYFALLNIYNNGGIFINYNVSVNSPFTTILKDRAFFARLSSMEYSDDLFGGEPGNPVIKAILETYNNKFYSDMPLNQRIKTILTAVFDIPLVIQTTKYHFCSAYSPFVFCYSLDVSFFLSNDINVTSMNLTNMPDKTEYTNIEKSILNSYLGNFLRKRNDDKTAASENNTDKSLHQKFAEIEKEIKEIKASNTYKFALKLKNFAKKPIGKIIYKIYMKKQKNHDKGR